MGITALSRSSRKQRKQLESLQQQMNSASDYAQWQALAGQHDQCSGAVLWRNADQTSLYDFAAIRSRLERLHQLRADKDDHGLLYALNEGIHGNMCGMGKPILYTRAMSGTKILIDEYVETICDCLAYLATLDDSIIPLEEKLEFFRRASHCYGRSALMLSGGGVLGNFHLGVVKILIEEKLLPVVISGASAGALVAAIVGTHTNSQYLKMFNDGSLFDALSQGAGKFSFSLLRQQLIGIEEVASGIARVVPDMTFAEAFQKTGRSINITVSPSQLQQNSRLLNHITSPNVLIRSAVMASCAIPGVFPPVTLMAKNIHGEEQPYLPNLKWTDGSFSQDLPAKRLSRIYGVNHFIVSQVNPAVLPLLSDPKTTPAAGINVKGISKSAASLWMRSSINASRKYLKLSPRMNMLIDTVHKLVEQEYTGDINIFPAFRYLKPSKIIAAGSLEDIHFLVDEGVKATLPKIPVVKNSLSVGSMLDKILLDFGHEGKHWLHSGPKAIALNTEQPSLPKSVAPKRSRKAAAAK